MTERIENLEEVVKKLQEAMQKNQGSRTTTEKQKPTWSSDETSEDKPVTKP